VRVAFTITVSLITVGYEEALCSMSLCNSQVDPVVDAAARSSGLDIIEIKSYLPTGLTLWIDPSEVSYRVGEHGQVQVSAS